VGSKDVASTGETKNAYRISRGICWKTTAYKIRKRRRRNENNLHLRKLAVRIERA